MLINEVFIKQLEINAPFTEGALMVEKRYHSGEKAKLGDVPLFAFLKEKEDNDHVYMIMLKEDELINYEVIDDKVHPPLVKVKN